MLEVSRKKKSIMYSPASVWETFFKFRTNSGNAYCWRDHAQRCQFGTARSYFSLIVCDAVLWIAANRRTVLSPSSGCTKFINIYLYF